MTTNLIIADENWQEVADGEDFVLENIDAARLLLLAYGDTAPTGTDAAHRIYDKDKGWLSSYGDGKVWIRSLVGECKVVISK